MRPSCMIWRPQIPATPIGFGNFYKRKCFDTDPDQTPPLSKPQMKKKCEKNIVESRRNSRIKAVEPPVKPTLENNSSASPLNSRRKNLILKHEILSPECDLFKASTPRRLHVVLLGKAAALVLVAVLVSFYAMRWEFGDEVERWAVGLVGLTGLLCFTSVTVMLLQTIEERILFIRGLGIQYSVRNALTHETSIFHPLDQIKSFYIFESPDGLKYGHFFALKIENQEEEIIIVLFEKMRPPVEFLKRVYNKFNEITMN